MKESRLDRMERLFRAALLHPPDEQEGFLEAACTDDPALREEVISLLRADREADRNEFLDNPISNLSGLASLPEEEKHRSGESSDSLVGTDVGPYRILRFLGHGGMGDVFLAVREEPFRHHVALKIIRRGMDSREVTRRFEMERQILASLSHTNIARLYDGGVTDDGLPYFAMEYVDGTPVTSWCDSRRMPLNDRLRLFQQICRAVHHAHQNLIIHRDLKPSNILVTGDGVPKLLDFGIAKLLNPNLGPAEAPVTRTEIRAMTPEYASPEQVRGESLTTASDIYSLGMILYELLSGHRPYRFVRRTPEEILSIICETEPERPSAVVMKPGMARQPEGEPREIGPEQISAERALSPDKLSKHLRGDLDNIVLMSLRKEPERRYASAQQLANDIEKHLAGEPVIAVRDSRGYRIGKYIRRNKVQTVSAAIILLLLIAASAVTMYQANQVAQQRDLAQLEAARSASVSAFLTSLFRAADPTYARTDSLTLQELLANGAERIESELAGQPEIQATLYDVIATAYVNLGRYAQAESLFERSLAIYRSFASDTIDLSTGLYNLGYTREMQARYSDAEQLFREALELREARVGKIDPSYLTLLYHLGTVTHLQGTSVEANRIFDAWQEIFDQLPSQSAPDPELTSATIGMANVAMARNQFTTAIRYATVALEASRILYGEDHPSYVRTLMLQASIHTALGESTKTEIAIRKVLATLQRLYPNGHQDFGTAYGLLAEAMEAKERYDDAERYFQLAVEQQARNVGPDHHSTYLAEAELARFYFHRGRFAESVHHYTRTVDGYATLYGDENLMTIVLRASLAKAMIRTGRISEVRSMLERDYAVLLRDHDPDFRPAQNIRATLDSLDIPAKR